MTSFCGVYEIVNTVNGKRYIGSSVDLATRLQKHKASLHRNGHRNEHLQRAWNAYGEAAFTFRPIIYCDRDKTLVYEQMCIDRLKPEYNISKNTTAPMLGLSLSEEHKSKIAVSMKGIKRTPEHQAKLAATQVGKKRSEEARRHMSEAHKGITQSKELIQKRTEARTGYAHSEETKKKISASNLGKKHSEETRLKMSQSRKGMIPWNKGKVGKDGIA